MSHMVGSLVVRYTGPVRPRGAFARTVRAALKASWFEMGLKWHKEFRPKHFTHAGAREYGYAARQTLGGKTSTFQSSYTGQKLRRYGHTLPLVYSGESREITRVRDVRATSKGVRVVMRANKLNLRHAGGRIDMRRELVTISQAEERAIVRAMDEALSKHINADTASSVTTIAAA